MEELVPTPNSALRTEDLRQRVLSSLPHQSLLVVDPELRLLLAEGGALETHGFRPELMVGQALADVLPAPSYERLAPECHAALTGEKRSLVLRSADGKAWYWIQLEPLRDAAGEIEAVLCVSIDITARKLAEEELAQTTHLLQDILDSLAEPVSVKDDQGRFLVINEAYERAIGVSRDHAAGKTVQEIYPPEFATRYAADDERVLREGIVVEGESEAPLADGTTGVFKMSRSPLRAADGTVYGLCAVGTDLSEQKRIEAELRQATNRFETAFSDAPIGMAMVGLDGRWLRANRALQELLGYPEAELMSLSFQDITYPEDLDADMQLVDQLLAGEIDNYTLEKRYFTGQGHIIWVLLSASLVRNADGEPVHFISQLQDISDRKRLETRLRELAERDPLTDLLNRRRFEIELQRQVERCRRYAEQACLLVMDVDRFKSINDQHGHQLGDMALRIVARVVRDRLRSSDVVARIGGDEFAAILLGVEPERAGQIAEEIRRTVAETSLTLAGQHVDLTISIGLHLLAAGTSSDDGALIAADKALYRAKRGGRDRVAAG